MQLSEFIIEEIKSIKDELNDLKKGQKMIFQLLNQTNGKPNLNVVGDSFLDQEVEASKPEPVRSRPLQVPSNQGSTPAFARFIETEGM